MDDDGAIFRIGRGVETMQVLCALDRAAAGHGQMVEASIEIGGEDFPELIDDREVGVRTIKAEDGFEADRFEIALFLRLLQGIGVDELAIHAAPVLAKGGGGELDDGDRRFAVNKETAKFRPCPCPDMVGLIDEQCRRSGRQLLLNLRIRASGDVHGRDDYIGAVKYLIDLGHRRWDVGQPDNHGKLSGGV